MFSDKERRAMWRRIVALESRMQDAEAATGASLVDDEIPVDPMNGPQTVKIDREVLDDLEAALQPLVNIADAFYRNELDNEARFWHGNEESPQFNTTDPKDVELYQGRGGKRLLTLKDVLNAKRAIIMLKAQFEGACRG